MPSPHKKKLETLNHNTYRKLPIIGLLIVVFISLAVGIVFLIHKKNDIDTSLNGSEVSEIHQRSIPPDVKKEILKQTHASTPDLVMKYASPGAFITYASPSATIRVPILMYHYIEYVQNRNDKTRISLDIVPSILEEQIKTLLAAHYNFLTNAELADVLDGKTNLPSNPILLTFDDGYSDFYTDAFPILKKYHVKATNYVITGFMNQPDHLSTNQITDLLQSGLVEIGAHTIHHVSLKGQSIQTDMSEVIGSKTYLENQFHIHVVSFAYPFGTFDQQAIQVVKNAGFKTAVSTIPGIEQNQVNRFFLFRLRPGVRTGQTLLSWLQQNTFTPY